MKNIYIKKTLFILFILLSVTSFSQNPNALNFDGEDDYVNVKQAFNFNRKNAFSVEAWIKVSPDLPAGSTDGLSQIVSKLDRNLVGWGMQIAPLANGNNGQLEVYFSSQPNGFRNIIMIDGSINLRDDNWHHVAFSYDGSGNGKGVRLYIDGQYDAGLVISSDALVGGDITNKGEFNIGRFDGEGNPDEHLNGSIDELRIWDGVKSEKDIKANFNRELKGNEPGLLGYFDFNQGIANGDNNTETSVRELTVNHNNGELLNFALKGNTSNFVDGVDFSKKAYCSSKGTTNDAAYIERVAIADVDINGNVLGNLLLDNTTKDNGGYADFTNMPIVSKQTRKLIVLNSSQKIKSKPFWTVWIDYNQNGVFDDNEIIVKANDYNISKAFVIPFDAASGSLYMRVSLKENAFPNACEEDGVNGNKFIGEVEDYLLDVDLWNTAGPIYTSSSFNNSDKLTLNTAISLTPNPTKGLVSIKSNFSNAEFEIFNSTGKVVYKGSSIKQQAKVDLSNQPKGIYLLKVTDNSSKKVTTQKLILN